MEGHRENKTAGDCQLDAEIKEGLLKHLDEHGPVSLFASKKSGQYVGCFLEEIENAKAGDQSPPEPLANDLAG